MTLRPRGSALLWTCALLMAGVVARASDPVHSRWRTEDVRIDGVMTDWSQLTFVSREVSTSVVNDRQDLYLIVATSDPAVIQQLTIAGLAVYLDAKGGKRQTFGVRIPPLGSRLTAGDAPSGEGDPPILSYFDVLGPGEDDLRRVEVDEPTGIELRIGHRDGTFVLEVKVPFVTAAGRPYAPGINVEKGDVGLGIVTPDPPRVANARAGGGGGRGGRLGGGGGPRLQRGKAVKIWTTIVLARPR